MDLIYTDSSKKDIGVLLEYDLDIAFGNEENDFELKLPLAQHCLSDKSWIYIEGTEYGGIVDNIKPDIEEQTVSYTGRSFHGIMESAVIYPDSNTTSLSVDGTADEVLNTLIERLDLTDIFEVVAGDASDEEISYNIPPGHAYTGICAMFQEYNIKLRMQYLDGKIQIWPDYITDYSDVEDFDSDQVVFTISQNYANTNHIVCFSSDGTRAYTIHLFTDGNGVVQPYTNRDNPIKDAHYILDTSRKVVTGVNEVVDIVINDSVDTVVNYQPLTELYTKQPDHWTDAEVMGQFYVKEDDEYTEAKTYTVYPDPVLTESVPDDWSANWGEYVYVSNVTEDGTKEYENAKTVYSLASYPLDWETNWSDYFIKKEDEYEAVPDSYLLLGADQPADWASNYTSYFKRLGSSDTYEQIEAYYGENALSTAPSDWVSNFSNYYIRTWHSGTQKYEYTNVTGVTRKEQVKKQPADWKKNYSRYSYYAWDGVSKSSSAWENVKADTVTKYYVMKSEPSDWKTNYTSYYKYDNATKTGSKKYSKPTKKNPKTTQLKKYRESLEKKYSTKKYTITIKSHGKNKNNPYGYMSFVAKEKKKTYISIEKAKSGTLTFKKNKYYKRVEENKTPKFATYAAMNKKAGDSIPKGVWLIQSDNSGEPSFESGMYWKSQTLPYAANVYYKKAAPSFYAQQVYIGAAPVWQENTYYEQQDSYSATPSWTDCYKAVEDHYASMIKSGIEAFQEAWKTDEITISFKESQEDIYDIGDVVGANENVTGINYWKPITKKILSLKSRTVDRIEIEMNVQYSIGG